MTGETARRLLMDAGGDALCDSCLAFACSVSLIEMRQVTQELLGTAGFVRGDRCASCRRTVPTVSYAAKCTQCSRPIHAHDDALKSRGDIFHAGCFNLLVSDENIRISQKLHDEARRLIEDARRVRNTRRNFSPRVAATASSVAEGVRDPSQEDRWQSTQ